MTNLTTNLMLPYYKPVLKSRGPGLGSSKGPGSPNRPQNETSFESSTDGCMLIPNAPKKENLPGISIEEVSTPSEAVRNEKHRVAEYKRFLDLTLTNEEKISELE